MAKTVLTNIARWLAAIGCFGISYEWATNGYEAEKWTLMLSAVPAFLLGVIFIWGPLFRFLTRPLTLWVDSLFFPGGKLSKPILNLKLPAYYIREERYEEALSEYQKIIHHHPDVAEAYEKAIWLHQHVFGQSDDARRLVRKAASRGVELDQRVVKSTETARTWGSAPQ